MHLLPQPTSTPPPPLTRPGREGQELGQGGLPFCNPTGKGNSSPVRVCLPDLPRGHSWGWSDLVLPAGWFSVGRGGTFWDAQCWASGGRAGPLHLQQEMGGPGGGAPVWSCPGQTRDRRADPRGRGRRAGLGKPDPACERVSVCAGVCAVRPLPRGPAQHPSSPRDTCVALLPRKRPSPSASSVLSSAPCGGRPQSHPRGVGGPRYVNSKRV